MVLSALALILAVVMTPPELPEVVPWKAALVDTGKTIIAPVTDAQVNDLALWAPTVVATGAAMANDVPLYRLLRDRVYDPRLGGHRVSYWGSYLGEGYVDAAAFAAVGLLGKKKGRRVCLEGLESLAAAALVSRGAKLAFRLERPSFDPGHKHWFSRLSADSFPSGHAMSAFASAAVLSTEYPELAPVFYLVATYVGLARVQQGTHWVSDVLVGAAIGMALGSAAVRINNQWAFSPGVSRADFGGRLKTVF